MKEKKYLWVSYIGGQAEKSLIEVHDIKFSIGKTIEDCYENLRNQWWGTPKSLHLDAWGKLLWADGYEISLEDYQQENISQKLYFVNLGGYDSSKFTELHENIFIVSDNEDNAKIKAKATVTQWETPHKDNLYEVENCFNVQNLLNSNKLYIHLTPTNKVDKFHFICKYVNISE